jgi:hypothetical protein
MPAAAISVHPADAVDSELLHLDLFQNLGLFVVARCFGLLFFRFHLHISPFGIHGAVRMRALTSFLCNRGAKNKTLIYPCIFPLLAARDFPFPNRYGEKLDTAKPVDFSEGEVAW